jgi:hypothetical protein
MIDETPALRARHRDKQRAWERGFVEELAVRMGSRGDRYHLGPRVLALVDESLAIIERGSAPGRPPEGDAA